ncbi:MAG: hypothetical protein ACTSU2_08660 [Promethearchaeota archaeon]
MKIRICFNCKVFITLDEDKSFDVFEKYKQFNEDHEGHNLATAELHGIDDINEVKSTAGFEDFECDDEFYEKLTRYILNA